MSFDSQNSTSLSSQLTMTHHILIIDSQVEDYQQLVAGAKPEFDVFVLDAHRDGIEQITEILSASRLTPHASLSLHIVSHGSPGTLYLGNSQLSLNTLELYTGQIKTWFTPHASRLTPHSLYLYGCNVAAGDAGEEFITKLNALTRANMAASTTPIGNINLGGNWELDSTHTLQQNLPFLSNIVTSYTGIFMADVVYTGTLNGTSLSFTFNDSASFISQATPIGFTDTTADGDGFGLDVVEGNSPTTLIANLSTGHGVQAFFGATGTGGAVNVPGIDFLIFDAAFSVDSYVVSITDTNGTTYGPLTLDPTINFGSYNGQYIFENSQSTFYAGSYTLNGIGVDISAFGAPEGTVISGFEILSLAEADFVMAGIPTINELGNSPFVADTNTVNNASPTFTSSTNLSTVENSTAVTTVVATDADGDTVAYSITGGADAALFSINNSTGELSFVNSPNYEDPRDSGSNNIYEVQVTANDGNGGTTAQTINVTVTDINDAPSIGGLPSPIKVAIVSEIAFGNKAGFEATLAQLNDDTYFDFDATLVSFADVDTVAELNQYDAVIIGNNGNSPIIDATFASALRTWVEAGGGLVSSGWIVYGDQNNTDIDAVVPVNTVAEYSYHFGAPLQPNGTVHPVTDGVSAFTVSSFTESSSGGIDSGATVLATTNSSPTVVIGEPGLGRSVYLGPLYSGSTGYNTTDLRSGEADQLLEQAVAWAVGDSGGSISETVTEDDALLTVDLLAGASDEDGDVLNAIDISLTGGDDSGIVVNGNSLEVNPSAYNYLTEGESEVIIYSFDISDGNGGTVAQTATITINGVNDAPTVSATVTGSATEDEAAFTVDLLAGASDVDLSDTLNVSELTLDSGNGAGVTINGNSLDIDPSAYGYLAEGESEVITYSYTISDGNQGGTVSQTATITINGVNDAPTVSATVTGSATEDDAAFTVDLLAGASDVDTSDTLKVSDLTLDSGDDAGVTINGNSLDIDPNAYNYLAVGESEVITYSYTISDGNGGTVAQTATITINGVNDAPTVSATVTGSATEDDAAFTVDLLAGASDIDLSDTLKVSDLTLDSGDDAGVTINGNSLDIDPSAYNSLAAGESEVITYSYTISDGNEGGTVSQTATITINGVNDALEITSSDAASVDENSTTVTTVVATDVDADSISYSITGGVDAALFAVDETTGELSFIAAPDAENPLDDGGDNIYQVEVTADDGNQGTDVQALTVTVGNVNDNLPVFTSSATPTLAENSTAVTTVAATDADGDSISYSISGGVDAALFEIDATTGALSFITAPNFEIPTDANSDNLYDVTVSASDGTDETTQSLSVSVTDLSNGVTDFNNDNLPDVVWRRPSTGQTNIWFTDGKVRLGGGPAGATIENPSWLTVGVGDFDKDGKRDDILWRNVSSGANVIWFMDGINKVGNATLDSIGTNWEVQGVGDFEHQDYTDDILWRNQSTGQTLVWTMDGASKTGTINFGTLGTAWKAQGVGDFEGNNFVDDIVWRNYTTGQTIVWETDGQQQTGSFALDTVGTNWKIDGVGDLDGDKIVDDLLWYNTSNNNVVTWFIDNGAKVASSTMGAPSNGWDAVL